MRRRTRPWLPWSGIYRGGFPSVASAQDFLQSGSLPDTACLIVDVRMPRMSGLALQQQLTKAHCPILIVFITAHGDEETRSRTEGRRGWLFGQTVQ